MVWWSWALLGLALLAAELLTPGGLYLLFFGLAALAVGALAGAGLADPPWLQWALFSILSVVSLLLFRGPLLARLKGRDSQAHPVDTLVGELATPLEDLAPGGAGKVELRGTIWNARNAGQAALARGRRSRVERVDGLTLWVGPE